MENVLFVIPARSGSQGIKNKNLMVWENKPLIMHSFDFLISKNISLQNICITTDSDYYIDFLKNKGVDSNCLLKRPRCLAENNVVDYPVILHAWSIKEELLKKRFEFIAIVRPTSPKRPSKIITEAISLLQRDRNITSVRAMRKVSEHPFRVWKKCKEYAYPLIEDVFEPGNIPRQKLDDNFYFQSGELEVVRRSTLQSGSISGAKVGVIEITEKNIDIDTADDL